MDSKTQGFFDVTQAAERLLDSLSEFRDQAHSYSAAEDRLEETRVTSQELVRATEQMATEAGNAIRILNDLGIPTLREDLSAVVQTTSLQAAELTKQSETLAHVAVAQDGQKKVLEAQGESLQKQREAIVGQAEALAKQHSVLLDQQQRLLAHQEKLSGVDRKLELQSKGLILLNEQAGTHKERLAEQAARLGRVENTLERQAASLDQLRSSLQDAQAVLVSMVNRLKFITMAAVIIAILTIVVIVLAVR
jgi:chromosome segregation ATPase